MTLKYTNIAGESSKLPAPTDKNYAWGTYDGSHLPELVTAPKPTKKTGTKGRQALAAAPIYTLEIEHAAEGELTTLQRLRKNRLNCLETANVLQQMADFDFKDALHKAADKIQNCSLAGAFRFLEHDVSNKIGQALCKNRLCPNCQFMLAAKRRSNFMDWLHMNEKPLAGFTFYHMVLTVRHSVALKLRDGLYTGELLTAFAQLRGCGKSPNHARRGWWDARISGGVFSVELAPGIADISAHIHIHVTLFCASGTIPIYRKDRASTFIKEASKIWRKLTNDPKGRAVFLEPIYQKREGKKVPYQKGESLDNLYQAVAECMKYTLKSDESSLLGYSPAFIRELLETPNSYFGRFGVLSQKTKSPIIFCELDRLNTNFQDLEAVAEREKDSLYNPETGTIYTKEETKIGLTYFRNTTTKTAPKADAEPPKGEKRRGGETYYQYINLRRVYFVEGDDKLAAGKFLARTIRGAYDTDNDIAYQE